VPSAAPFRFPASIGQMEETILDRLSILSFDGRAVGQKRRYEGNLASFGVCFFYEISTLTLPPDREDRPSWFGSPVYLYKQETGDEYTAWDALTMKEARRNHQETREGTCIS
jgi:hypothetical protein